MVVRGTFGVWFVSRECESMKCPVGGYCGHWERQVEVEKRNDKYSPMSLRLCVHVWHWEGHEPSLWVWRQPQGATCVSVVGRAEGVTNGACSVMV